MNQQNPILAKILILDTGKFEQWQFRIQQYLQHEHYALWEVIEFRDSYEAPANVATTGTASDGTGKKKGRIVTLTADDIKYKTAQELWAAILKTFGGNEATKKTKKNLLKQQYGNFKVEGSKTLEHSFNRLQVIVSQLQFIDVEIKHDDLNQNFLTSLAPEWLMHTIVWRNRSDLDTMSLDDLYNHLKVYESEVQKKSKPNSQNMAFISSAKYSSRNEKVNTASVSTTSTNVSTASANIEVATISQDTALLMAIDGVRWDWSYMANDEENHALISDEETPTEFALMAKTSAETSKDLDSLLESQRLDKNNEGLGYSVVPPPPAQIYSPPKKDMSWTGLLEFKDDTVTDYSRPSPAIESTLNDAQNKNPSVTKTEASPSTISPKPFIKFVKTNDSPTKSKTYKVETAKKPPVNKRVKRGTSRSQNNTHKSFTPRPAVHKPYRPPMRPMRSNMNSARPNRTSFNKPTHSYTKRPFQRTSAVRSQYRAPWGPTVNINVSNVNRKFSTASRKFPTSSTKFSTADLGKKENVVKASACWFWNPSQNLSNKGPNSNSVSVMFKKYTYIDTQDSDGLGPQRELIFFLYVQGSSHNNIDDKGYWDSDCSRHMTGNISYLFDYQQFDRGYVSFGQGGCKITGKGTIKIGKLEFENVYFVKDLKYNLFSVSQIYDNNNSVMFTDSECIVLGRDFKLLDDANVLLRTPRQHNMYSIDLNDIVPHKDLTCLVAKAFADEGSSIKRLTFFLKTKDEPSGILRKFITEIENLKDLKVKTIRCDNGGEFRNKEMDEFCSQKGIKREFSNARTPQQNGVAKRRNRTLIEAARTMLADAKLPVTFWAEAINTACYVQNMVLINKSHNKTPYELFNGRSPAIGFHKPFGCHVMILNTLDHLGKFKVKGDEDYFIGYSMSSKAFRDAASQEVKKDVSSLRYIALPNWVHDALLESSLMETPIPTVSSPVPTACFTDSQEPSSDTRLISKRVANQVETPSLDNILTLTNRFEDILEGTTNSDESNGVEAN
nr:ribonuclease H-like domain-containing protein [Tanacetum cinerariifolium]